LNARAGRFLFHWSLDMWCSACQQDVPGIAAKEGGSRICCARCNGVLAGGDGNSAPPAIDAASGGQSEALDTAPFDDWSLAADLATISRVVESFRRDGPADGAGVAPPHRIDPIPAREYHGEARRELRPPAKRNGLLAWPALMLGMMAFACGAVLVGWSFVANRGDLWAYGLPCVLGGQALLIVGLILQLDGLWQSDRHTRETLSQLDGDLAELRHATALMSTTHSSAGQSFYAHMAEGASPHLLLADVKGQLDVIAMRLSQSR
jgi:hypothetical protein